MYIFLSLFLQQASHYSPLKSGGAFLPVTLAAMTGALTGVRLVARIGVRRQLVFSVLAAAPGPARPGTTPVLGTYCG